MSMNPRALVTGATGFLGGHLCARLLGEGVEVRAAVRREGPQAEALRAAGVEIYRAGLDDPEGLRRAAAGVEVVFHAAAVASYVAPRAVMEAVNVGGTRNVLAAARGAGVGRVVHVSSESVTLADRDRRDEDETRPLPRRFLDHYSRTKAWAEREVLAANGAGLETVAVRPPWIWGEGDTSVLKALARPIQAGRLAPIGDGRNRITTGHAQNVSAGLIAAARSPQAPGRVYHVADDGRPTLWEFISRLCAACDLPPPQRQVPYRLAYLAATAADLMRALGFRPSLLLSRPYIIHLGRTWTFSDRRAREELGYCPVVSLEEGFERLAAWVRAQGGLEAAWAGGPGG